MTPYGLGRALNMPGYFCNAVAKFPVPENFWQALTTPNLIYYRTSIYTNYLYNMETYRSLFLAADRSTEIRFLDPEFFDKFYIVNNFERAQHMFVTSVIYRILQIASTSVRNFIDTQKWNTVTKMLVSGLVILAPYIMMNHFLDWNMIELGIVSQLENILSFGLNYLNATAWSNRLRELHVVSRSKDFNSQDIFTRGGLSSFVNLVVTTGIDFSLLFILGKKLPAIVMDQASITYCQKGEYSRTLILHQEDAHFASYFTDELGWLVGRYAVDFSFAALNFLGVIKDLRTPFNVWQTSRPKVVVAPEKQEVLADHVRKAGQAKARVQAKPMAKLDIDSAFSPAHYSSAMPLPQARVKPDHEGRIKVKTRPGVAPEAPVVQKAPVNCKLDISDIIETNSSGSIVRLQGDGVAPDTWAIVCLRTTGDQRLFERSLRSSGRVHPGAAIQTVGSEIFELRPAGIDKRSLAEPSNPYEALKRLVPLGEAIAADQALRDQALRRESASEPRLVAFERVVRHGYIAREISRIIERRATEAASR